MTHHGFRRERAERYGCSVLEYSAPPDARITDKTSLVIDRLSFRELAAFAGVPDETAKRMASDRDRVALHDGWQSRSMAGECGLRDRVRGPLFFRGADIPSYRGGRRRFGFEREADFFGYLRSGDDYLAFVSRNVGTPPVRFLVNARTCSVAVDLYAPGKAFGPGERAAELCVFHAKGFFALRDRLAEIFSGINNFDRLSFLATSDGARGFSGGYGTRRERGAGIDERAVLGGIDATGTNANLANALFLERGRPAIYEIGEGWELATGDWRPGPGFPGGMKRVAGAIAAKGLVPGIRIAPFVLGRDAPLIAEKPEWILRGASGRPVKAGRPDGRALLCLDLSIPDVQDYLFELARSIVEEWGFRYVKLDHLYAGMLPGRFRNGGSPYLHYGKALDGIVSLDANAAGEPVAFAGCGAPLEPSLGRLPLMRFGPDARESWEQPFPGLSRIQGRPSAKANMLGTIGRSALSGAAFLCDPDAFFFRDRNMRLTEAEKELVAVVGYALGSQVMISDDVRKFGREASFVKRIVDLFDRMGDAEFGATRLARDVFGLETRSGSLKGVANLSDAEFAVPEWPERAPLLTRGRVADGKLYVEPHSVALFDASAPLAI